SNPVEVTRGTPRTDILATFFPVENCFLSQRTTIVVTNPLTVTPIAASAGELTLRIENQGAPFSGFIQIQHMDAPNAPTPVQIGAGETILSVPCGRQPADEAYRIVM